MTSKEVPTKGSELIVYQIGELKNLMTEMRTETKAAHESYEKRLTAIELWQAAEIEKNKNEPKVDVQKIILGAFGIAMAALAALESGVLRR